MLRNLMLTLTAASLVGSTPAFAAEEQVDAPYGVMQAYERDEIARNTPKIQVQMAPEDPALTAQRAIEAGLKQKERALPSDLSYSEFLQAIKDNLIERISVDANGHTALF